MAEHCCIVASLEELGLKVVVAEPKFGVMAAELEKGLHSPKGFQLEAKVAEPEFVVVAVGLERGPHLPEV